MLLLPLALLAVSAWLHCRATCQALAYRTVKPAVMERYPENHSTPKAQALSKLHTCSVQMLVGCMDAALNAVQATVFNSLP